MVQARPILDCKNSLYAYIESILLLPDAPSPSFIYMMGKIGTKNLRYLLKCILKIYAMHIYINRVGFGRKKLKCMNERDQTMEMGSLQHYANFCLDSTYQLIFSV